MTGEATNPRAAFATLSAALERDGFRGWDPYDGLSSPLLQRIAPTRLTRGAAIQLLKRSPLNLRPLLGVPRRPHAKGLALCASAYAVMARVEPDGPWAAKAGLLAERLLAAAVPAGEGLGWGYDFDVQTRWAHYRRGQPNAIVTTFAANALLDVAELGDRDAFREPVAGVLAYARSQLAREAGEAAFFAYYEGSSVPIHNANALVAGLLARAGDDADAELAQRAAAYTLTRQQADGRWAYGEGPRLDWVDGYHTAFVLDGLEAVHARTGGDDLRDGIARGLDLYIARLFDGDGAPRATLESRWPIDVHAASTAIGSLSRLASYHPQSLATAARVLGWTMGHLRRRDGRYAFQLHPRYRNSVPYFRWNDAHMMLGLARHVQATSAAGALDRVSPA